MKTMLKMTLATYPVITSACLSLICLGLQLNAKKYCFTNTHVHCGP